MVAEDAAVLAQAPEVDGLHPLHQRDVPIRARRRGLRRRDHRIELREQHRRQPRHVADAPVVRDEDLLRAVPEHPLDRSSQRLGLELHRRRRRHDPRAGGGVELAVRETEGVAGEEAPARLVPDAVVMHRVTRRVEELQRPAGKLDRHAVGRLEDALGRHRHQRAVRAFDLLGAVHRGRAFHQVHGVDQVSRAARMDDEPRFRQLLHQEARAAGVVEMHVGGDDVVDRIDAEPDRVECREQARHRVVGARVDEGGTVALDDQVGGVESRAVKAGIDDVDAMADRLDGTGIDVVGGKLGHANDSREQVASGALRRAAE